MTNQIQAIKLAITALTERRRTKFASGESAWLKGLHSLDFAATGHLHYTEHSEAIQQLEDLIEILRDPGVIAQAVKQ